GYGNAPVWTALGNSGWPTSGWALGTAYSAGSQSLTAAVQLTDSTNQTYVFHGVAGSSTGSATQLSFSQPPPATMSAGDTFSLQLEAKDQNGNFANTFNGAVTLSLGSNPGDASLGGTTTLSATNGLVTFTGLSIDLPANGYTIVASASGVSNATTSSILVGPT